MKKLLIGLVLMLSGAIIVAGALIAGGTWVGGSAAGGYLYDIFESSTIAGFTFIGAIIFLIGLVLSITEANNKDIE